MPVRYPDVTVQLSHGQDGNIFAIIGTVGQKLEKAGHADVVSEFVHDVTSADSYHEALGKVMRWVTVT